jgi:hypothetical protein
MRYLIALAVLALSACASNPNNIKTSAPVKEQTQFTQVEGVGSTPELALQDAFKRAIEKVVGDIVVSTNESRNDRLVRKDILTHSAGYVDNYEVIKEVQYTDGWHVHAVVYIKSSRIANRILGGVGSTDTLQGDRMATQHSTYLNERNTGDKLVKEVLGSFPKNAFVVTRKDAQFQLRSDRAAVLVVSYNMKWNKNYVKALNETMAVLQDGKNTSIAQQRFFIQSIPIGSSWLGRTDAYYFNDAVRANKIREYMSNGQAVRASVVDDAGRILFASCANTQWMADFKDTYHINQDSHYRTSDEVNDTIQIAFPPNSPHNALLKYANELKLEVVSERQCQETMARVSFR